MKGEAVFGSLIYSVDTYPATYSVCPAPMRSQIHVYTPCPQDLYRPAESAPRDGTLPVVDHCEQHPMEV